MIMDQIRLTVEDIVNKEFKKSMRGYNEEEVDQFLDTIIEDYETFQRQIRTLEEEVKRLKQRTSTSHNRSTNVSQQAPVNYDILKRISNLEKAVFGPKVTENGE
ncbi:MAG TPA: cell division regulator GpsB [Pseudogracilibacillus sp.]|nr:cell division regulator GpsB [Pseudogracilibacillus sp.]